MTKEIHDINTRALDFVVELIEYIFEYPNDDYMTMECLCRKLHKYGLVEKKDGFYLAAGCMLRKNESQTELVNDSPILVKDLIDDEFNPYDEECMRCKHLKLRCEFVPSYCKYESRNELQMERSACDTCQWYNSGIPCGVEPSVCKREIENGGHKWEGVSNGSYM